MQEPKTELEVPEYEQVHLIEYVNTLLRRRWLIIIGVLTLVLVVGVLTKLTAPKFTAAAKFLPSKNPDMISRMGTLVGGGQIESFQDNVTSEYYAEIIKSGSFLERIAAKKWLEGKDGAGGAGIDLGQYYKVVAASDKERLLRTVEKIGKKLDTSTDRTTKVVSLSYTTKNAALSAAIVNGILDDLIVYNQDIRDNKAKQNRVFVENQLKDNLELLRQAESALADFSGRNKRIVTPELEVESDRLKRAVKVQEEVYITLKKQLELAKIEEQQKKPAIEIIQRAEAPLRKSGPSTVKNVMLAGFAGLVLFMGLAFMLEYASKMDMEEERNMEFRKNLQAIKGDFNMLGRVLGIRRPKPKSGIPPK